MPNIGPMELVLVLVVALLVLGPKKLPEAGRGLGRAIRGFKASVSGQDEDHASVLSPAKAVSAGDHPVDSR